MPGDSTVRTDGQLAYETYTCHVGGDLPPWDQLTVSVKAGWEAAAEAVIQARYAEEDEPSRAERWGITDADFAEADLLDVGYLLEEDQPWRSGGVRPGE